MTYEGGEEGDLTVTVVSQLAISNGCDLAKCRHAPPLGISETQ